MYFSFFLCLFLPFCLSFSLSRQHHCSDSVAPRLAVGGAPGLDRASEVLHGLREVRRLPRQPAFVTRRYRELRWVVRSGALQDGVTMASYEHDLSEYFYTYMFAHMCVYLYRYTYE